MSISFKGKVVAITGASGSLGRALLTQLEAEGATLIAFSSKPDLIVIDCQGIAKEIKTIQWQVGLETDLVDHLRTVDILILNHGVNVHDQRSPEAIERSYEVNTFSSWRLMELFLHGIQEATGSKEVWVNTSEAEVLPAVSPLYELSKRTLGDLITLRRLDAPCIIRKLILGPFKSQLNPMGILESTWVARQIIILAKQDVRNIIVTVNPLTFVLFPLKEFFVSAYFRLFSRPS
jgi:hypothetical protein